MTTTRPRIPETRTASATSSDRAAPPRPRPPRTCTALAARVVDGRFVLHEELGRGGMGVVLRARDRGLGGDVALKLALDPLDRNGRRLAREARVGARLEGLHLVRLLAHGTDEGRPYAAFELVPGARALTDALPRAPRAQRLAWVRQAALGLAVAHRRGVVHRDVKGDNVLVDGDGRARVIDFGLAWTGDDPDGEADTRRAVGTPHCMSPEQILGDPPSPAADVWALGCLLFLALTDRHPFVGETRSELYRAALRGPRPSPRALDPSVPRALDDLCRRALVVDPAGRPPDAAAFADALEAAERRPGRRRWWRHLGAALSGALPGAEARAPRAPTGRPAA